MASLSLVHDVLGDLTLWVLVLTCVVAWVRDGDREALVHLLASLPAVVLPVCFLSRSMR